MPAAYPPSTLARRVLTVLIALNLATGGLMVLAVAASFVFEATLIEHFASRPTGIDPLPLVRGLRLFALVGLPIFPLLHLLLDNLRAVVRTVSEGDPFVPENAVRLRRIAWLLLGVELLHLGFGVMAHRLSSANAEIEWTFSITGWVAVLLIFILTHVFEHGTRMRQDIEGTV
ncbi:MAG: DUF2975 domain-containing protein [Gemmatimonadaceae bacterium]